MIKKVKITDVKGNPKNPRVAHDESFNKLVTSIKEFPQMLEIRPIVVNDEMVVLGGNQRLRACQAAGLKEIPIIKASDLTPEQQKEFIIRDNVNSGAWDWERLANEWSDINLESWGLKFDFDEKGILEEYFNEPTPPTEFKITLEYTEADYHKIVAVLDKLQGTRERIIFDKLIPKK